MYGFKKERQGCRISYHFSVVKVPVNRAGCILPASCWPVKVLWETKLPMSLSTSARQIFLHFFSSLTWRSLNFHQFALLQDETFLLTGLPIIFIPVILSRPFEGLFQNSLFSLFSTSLSVYLLERSANYMQKTKWVKGISYQFPILRDSCAIPSDKRP